jgi:hypothetical protein
MEGVRMKEGWSSVDELMDFLFQVDCNVIETLEEVGSPRKTEEHLLFFPKDEPTLDVVDLMM